MNITHEFRTPLTIILGFGRQMTDGALTTKEELNSLGIPPDELNGMLTCFMESNLIEYKQIWKNGGGYMICGHAGIAAYMVLAAAFLLAKKKYTLSEFMPV